MIDQVPDHSFDDRPGAGHDVLLCGSHLVGSARTLCMTVRFSVQMCVYEPGQPCVYHSCVGSARTLCATVRCSVSICMYDLASPTHKHTLYIQIYNKYTSQHVCVPEGGRCGHRQLLGKQEDTPPLWCRPGPYAHDNDRMLPCRGYPTSVVSSRTVCTRQ